MSGQKRSPEWSAPVDDVPTLNNTIARYITVQRGTGNFREASVKGARWTLENFAAHVGGKTAIARVKRAHVESYLSALKVADSTKGVRLSRIRSFFAWCVANELAKRNPCAGIDGPRRPATSARGLKLDEIERLFQCADERLALVLSLMLQEGLRRAECCGLSTSSIDWDHRTVHVIGKGGKERLVPLSDETAAAIDAYLSGSPAGPHQPLLRSKMNPAQGITATTLGNNLTRLFGEAGLKRAPYDGKSGHAARHTCANDMLDQGADLRDVQEMLGHTNLSTTANIYAKRLHAVGRLRNAAAGRNYRGPSWDTKGEVAGR